MEDHVGWLDVSTYGCLGLGLWRFSIGTMVLMCSLAPTMDKAMGAIGGAVRRKASPWSLGGGRGGEGADH